MGWDGSKFYTPYPDPYRCEVKNPTTQEQCPEVADYVLTSEGRSVKVCSQCQPTWIRQLTIHGEAVTVTRFDNRRRVGP